MLIPRSGMRFTKRRVVQSARTALKALAKPGFTDFMDPELEELKAAPQLVEGQTGGFSDEDVRVIALAVHDTANYEVTRKHIWQGLFTRLFYEEPNPIPKNTRLSHIAAAGAALYEADQWSRLYQQFMARGEAAAA